MIVDILDHFNLVAARMPQSAAGHFLRPAQ
jgi:hypothetical protein